MKATRRSFLKHTAEVAAAAGLADLVGLNRLPRVSAQEAQMPRNWAAVASDVEPLVRMLEDTPRSRVIEVAAERVRSGTCSYQQLLAAVMLAGVRGIRPRPVGFKFHAVLVINATHLASLASNDRDRWLPLFWSFDAFKASQERNRTEGNWHMPLVEEARLPTAAEAGRRFREAMDRWDESAVDVAVAAWSRTAGLNEIYEALWRYGARDFRDIGHKAIYVANSYRTLQAIGDRHAEPILRSLAFALLEHEGTNPAERDDEKDRPWRDNIRRAGTIRADWRQGRVAAEATTTLLETLRQGSAADASEQVVRLLNDRIDPQCIWDGLFLGATELLTRQPGIVGLHCVTSMNALHFAYRTSSDDETRRMMMLQGAAFLPMFLAAMRGRARFATAESTRCRPSKGCRPSTTSSPTSAATSRRRPARRSRSCRRDPSAAPALMTQARRLIFSKGPMRTTTSSAVPPRGLLPRQPDVSQSRAGGERLLAEGERRTGYGSLRRTREALNRT